MAKRRPKGPEHLFPEEGQWYRTPLYDKSHMLDPDGDGGSAYCGRALDIDPIWWVDSGWEEFTELPWFLIVDQRKNGTCSPCRTIRKDREALAADIGEVGARRHESPLNQRELRQLTLREKASTLRTRQAAAWVARELGGHIVESEHGARGPGGRPRESGRRLSPRAAQDLRGLRRAVSGDRR